MLGVALALFAGLAFAAFVVAVAPEAFLTVNQPDGQPVRDISAPAAPALVTLAGIVAAAGGACLTFLNKTTRFQMAAVAVLVLGVQASAYVAYELWEFHESPEFCVRTCHVMEPTYMTFAEPGHNQVMVAHIINETAQCLDCHTGPGLGGQLDLMVTSARHVWKYWVTHDYDPDDLGGADAVRTVPDENCLKCHGDGLRASLPEEHDRFKTQCAMCHSPHHTNATGYFFPDAILEKDDCSLCHRDAPLDFVTRVTGHSEVAQDCRECHATHGNRNPDDIRTCTDAGCHDQDAANQDSLVALKHVAFEESECQTCHGGAHNLTAPSLERLERDCLTCHADHEVPASHAAAEGARSCTACHGAGAPVGGLAKLGAHGNQQCDTCHDGGGDAPRLAWSQESDARSQVAWMRARGAGFANWTGDGRGHHDPTNQDCGQCHQPHSGDALVFPETCDEACHGWLTTIDQPGFSGLAGTPVYRDTIRPAELLERSKDLDGDGRDHKLINERWGCTGFCHNPAITLEIAEAWGVPIAPQNMGQQSVEPPPMEPGTEHGYVSVCTDCHRFGPPVGEPDELYPMEDLHTTHIPFIQAEMPADDTARTGQTACAYCHNTGPYPENLSGGCYNCHLSGHWPETVYWGTEP